MRSEEPTKMSTFKLSIRANRFGNYNIYKGSSNLSVGFIDEAHRGEVISILKKAKVKQAMVVVNEKDYPSLATKLSHDFQDIHSIEFYRDLIAVYWTGNYKIESK
jgi:hypothetical protein